MVQSAFQQNGRRKRKIGEMTAEGRRSQIQYKLGHGISPVLLGVERQSDWESHYEGVCRALNPGNEFEADLAYLIAWQFWRFGRLIRHETELTSQKIANPDLSFGNGHLSRDAIRAVLTLPSKKLEQAQAASEELLGRYAAIGSGATDVVFTPVEVRSILEAVLTHVQEGMDDDRDDDDGDGEEEGNSPDIDVEERPWTAAEIAEQIQVLSQAAGVDWREELEHALYTKAQEAHEQRGVIAEARAHITRRLILGEKYVSRLSLYERQINSVLKSTYNLLERARAYRTGQPIAPPVSLDVTISKGTDAIGL
jgi:hypothetical protein